MADTSVAVTAGTGTAIDTRTEGTNGNHRQVIVIGDPDTNAGVAPVSATAGLKVDLGADNDITGTVAVSTINSVAPAFGSGVRGATVQRVTIATDDSVAVTMATNTPVGNVAHDNADSGAPVKIGAKAEATPSTATMVADLDRTDLIADLDGSLLVKSMAFGDLISERVANTDGNSTAFTNFGATASARNYVYAYSIFRTDAGTTPIFVDFRDGTAGSILYSVVIPPNGGANLSSDKPLFRTTANTALAYDVSAATTTVYISVSGFKSRV